MQHKRRAKKQQQREDSDVNSVDSSAASESEAKNDDKENNENTTSEESETSEEPIARRKTRAAKKQAKTKTKKRKVREQQKRGRKRTTHSKKQASEDEQENMQNTNVQNENMQYTNAQDTNVQDTNAQDTNAQVEADDKCTNASDEQQENIRTKKRSNAPRIQIKTKADRVEKRGRKKKPVSVETQKKARKPKQEQEQKKAVSKRDKIGYFLSKDHFQILYPETRPYKNKKHAIECLLPYHIFDNDEVAIDVTADNEQQLQKICDDVMQKYKQCKEKYNESKQKCDNIVLDILKTEELKYFVYRAQKKLENAEQGTKTKIKLRYTDIDKVVLAIDKDYVKCVQK